MNTVSRLAVGGGVSAADALLTSDHQRNSALPPKI